MAFSDGTDPAPEIPATPVDLLRIADKIEWVWGDCVDEDVMDYAEVVVDNLRSMADRLGAQHARRDQ